MKKTKYFILGIEIVILLIALFFPQIYPYHQWLNKKPISVLNIDISIPTFQMIGKVFYPFFLFILPLIVILYFSDKYFNQEKNKKVFIKLPLIALLISVVGYFASLFFAGFDVCSGEECMGVGLAFIFTIPAFIIFSLICSGMIYYVNKKESSAFVKEKVNKLIGNKYLHIIFFAFVLILFLVSITLSYNCGTLLTKQYDNCKDYKLHANEEKIFFSEKFPSQILDLKRADYVSAWIANNFDITKYLTANKYGYNVGYHSENYSYRNAGPGNILEGTNNYDINILFYKNNRDVDRVMSVVKKDIKEHNIRSNFIPQSAFSEIKDINGNKIFCIYSDYRDKYLNEVYIHDDCIWYNIEGNYIVKIRGDGPYVWRDSTEGKKYQDDLHNILKYTSDLYPASRNADYND